MAGAGGQTRFGRVWIGGVGLSLAAGGAPAAGQIAEFLGPHVTEEVALDGEIRGTGRIGGITIDRYGNLYVANQDADVWRIRATGEVELFATGFLGSSGNVALPSGELVQGSFGSNEIFVIDRDGHKRLLANGGLAGPVGMAVGRDGAIYVTNYNSDYLSRVTLDGEVAEFARDGRFEGPNGITVDLDGNLYVVNLRNTYILKVTPAGEVSEIARLPGQANAHVAFAGGALYVTQIWDHVVLRVEMDGSYQVVAGDGTLGFEPGEAGTSRVAYPNGITARPTATEVYFNTLRGNMVAGERGVIEIQRIHIPNPNRAFVEAYTRGGIEGLRVKFDASRRLREVQAAQLLPGWYAAARRLFLLGHADAGLALTEWAAALDSDDARAAMQVGTAHAVYGDKGEAIAHLERAVALRPDDEALRLRLEAVRMYRR